MSSKLGVGGLCSIDGDSTETVLPYAESTSPSSSSDTKLSRASADGTRGAICGVSVGET
jgi:hypothetical protein